MKAFNSAHTACCCATPQHSARHSCDPLTTGPIPVSECMPKAKKYRPVVGHKTRQAQANIASEQPSAKRHQKQCQPQAAAAAVPPVQKSVNKPWRCSSIIDQQASEAVGRLLHAAATKSAGATIKSLTLAPHIVHKKPTFAVTCETLKHLPLLKLLVQHVRLVEEHAPQLTEAASYVLAYELLFGEGCRQHGPAEKAVTSAKADMQAHLRHLHQQHATGGDTTALLQLLRASSAATGAGAGLAAANPAAAGGTLFAADGSPLQHPRTARVNLLKASVQGVLQELRRVAAAAGAGSKAAVLADAVEVDPLLPDVLVWPAGTDLHDHSLVVSGQLILQSKASCLVAHALAPGPGWTVVDCCAAPGNKTTHVASLLAAHSSNSSSSSGGRTNRTQGSSGKTSKGSSSQGGQGSSRGRVLAFDKDPKRLKRLQANAERAGAADIITARCADFLSLDPLAPEFAQVQGVVLDPSCSGSGTGVSRMDHLLPAAAPTAAPAALTAPTVPIADPQDGRGRQQGAGKKRKQQQMQQAVAGGAASPTAAAAAGGLATDGVGVSLPLDEDTQKRVEQLAKFQEAALRHALKFPTLQRLVYSTCSVYQRENEDVVAAVLPTAAAAGFHLVDPFPTWHRRGLQGAVEGAEKLVRTHAAEDGTDGFFVAVLERKGRA